MSGSSSRSTAWSLLILKAPTPPSQHRRADHPVSATHAQIRRAGKPANAWVFAAPKGGPLNEGNWKRTVRWSTATRSIGKPTVRVHDLRHTAASLWLGAGADPKVVQRILGHASAAMTMDPYGHLHDDNLWDAATRVSESGDRSGTRRPNHEKRKAAAQGKTLF